MNNEAESPRDIPDQDDRITKIHILRNELVKRGRIGTYSYFRDFPDKAQELLVAAGTSKDPVQQIRWELLFNVRRPTSRTSFRFELPLSAQHIEELIIYLRTRGSKKADDESGLLFFDLTPKGKGIPTQNAKDILAKFKDWGRPEHEFWHLPLLEDLFRFAEPKNSVQPRVGRKPGLGYKIELRRPGIQGSGGTRVN